MSALVNPLLAALLARFDDLPPRLSIPLLAELLKENEPAVRAQIDRNQFPMTLHRQPYMHVMLADFLRWYQTGETQPQLDDLEKQSLIVIKKRGRGRPSNAERAAAASEGVAHA